MAIGNQNEFIDAMIDAVAFGELPVPVETPGYLHKIYWWAYEHPLAGLSPGLWSGYQFYFAGNYDRLVNAVLDGFSDGLDGDTLQISCAYGKLTPRLESRLSEGGRLDVIDVLKVQLENVRRKLKWPGERVRLSSVTRPVSIVRTRHMTKC